MPKLSATSQAQVRRTERQQMAVELRKSGLDYRGIAEAVRSELKLEKYEFSQAYVDVRTWLEKVAQKIEEDAEQVLRLDLLRLDEMMAALWTNAMSGNVMAVDAILRIMDRKHILLGMEQHVASKMANQGPTTEEKPISIVKIFMPTPAPALNPPAVPSDEQAPIDATYTEVK